MDTSGHALIGTDCCLMRSAQRISEYATSNKAEPVGSVTDGIRAVFPNPASELARIHLTLAAPAHVEVSVVDELGRSVAMILDRHVPSGVHRLEWKIRNLASGRYTIRATIGGAVYNEPVIVAK